MAEVASGVASGVASEVAKVARASALYGQLRHPCAPRNPAPGAAPFDAARSEEPGECDEATVWGFAQGRTGRTGRPLGHAELAEPSERGGVAPRGARSGLDSDAPSFFLEE